MKFTLTDVDACIAQLNLPMEHFMFTKEDLLSGMDVELEHGKKIPLTNVSDDNMLITFKIALAHLLEFPDYYDRLEKLEIEAKKYWNTHPRYK